MMFRDGSEIEVRLGDDPADRLLLDTLIVADAAEEAEARKVGWRVSLIQDPLDHDLDGRRGGSVPKTRRKAR